MWQRFERWIAPLVISVGVIVMGRALVDVWLTGDWSIDAFRLSLGLFLAVASSVLLTMAWLALTGSASLGAAREFAFSLAGRYLPLGIGQPVALVAKGEVGSAVGTSVHFATLLALSAAASGLVALPLALDSSAARSVRIGAAAGGLLVLLVHRSVLGFVVSKLPRRVQDSLPRQGQLLAALLLLIPAFAVLGVQFDLVIGQEISWLSGSRWCLAWLAGFLVFPLPAGIGVREAVLVGLFADVAGQEAVLASSLLQRGLVISGDLVLMGLAALGGLTRRA